MIMFVHMIDEDDHPIWQKIDCDRVTINPDRVFGDRTTIRLFNQYYKGERPLKGFILNVANKPTDNARLRQLYFNNTTYNISNKKDFMECYKELQIFLQNEELERLLATL